MALAPLLLAAELGSRAMHFDGDVVARYALQNYGARNTLRLEKWLASIEKAGNMTEITDKLNAVNDFWNDHIIDTEDRKHWGVPDYWATPLETLAAGRGDCEDFVIGKYFTLVQLGVPVDALHLIYVRADMGGRSVAHMVLGYYETPESQPLILDNLRPSILTAAKRSDLSPVFSFNAEGIYAARGVRGDVGRISRWQGVLARMKREGFDFPRESVSLNASKGSPGH